MKKRQVLTEQESKKDKWDDDGWERKKMRWNEMPPPGEPSDWRAIAYAGQGSWIEDARRSGRFKTPRDALNAHVPNDLRDRYEAYHIRRLNKFNAHTRYWPEGVPKHNPITGRQFENPREAKDWLKRPGNTELLARHQNDIKTTYQDQPVTQAQLTKLTPPASTAPKPHTSYSYNIDPLTGKSKAEKRQKQDTTTDESIERILTLSRELLKKY